jgi:hypothetical protein
LLSDTEFLATFDVGEAVESFDYHTVVAGSTDRGNGWELIGPLLSETPEMTTHSVRTSRLADGTIVGFGGFYRRRAEEDLVNRQTFGLVPVDLFTVRSTDGGRTWSKPRMVSAPLEGPSWEICHPIVELTNGTWIAPTSTWRGWAGNDYPGDRAVVLISNDGGESWPHYGTTFDGRNTGLSYLEQSVVALADGLILAVSWVYELTTGRTRPSVYALSSDGGLTFSEPRPTGFDAQTCKVIQLRDGRLLCIYRRNDIAGLWATISCFEDGNWTNSIAAPLWQGADSGMQGVLNRADELSGLKFGHPSIRQLSPDEVLVLFWCQEQCVTNIRWIRLRLE